jgi:hypothetical protein
MSTNTKKKIDLTPSLKRPMDRGALSNDSATLRALVGQLNNPALTGADVPDDQKPAPSAQSESQPTIPQDSIPTADEQQPPVTVTKGAGPAVPPATSVPSTAPAPSVTVKKLVMLTGRNAEKVARAVPGAQTFRLYGPVAVLADYLFPGFDEEIIGAAQTLGEIIAWGNGEVDDDHPISTQRIVFVKMIRSLAGVIPIPSITWANFGNPGFWVDACLNGIKDSAEKSPGTQIFLLGILNKIEFQYFAAQKFSHWHVMSPRAPGGDDLNSMLDNSVTRQISQQRDGAKLMCVWSEERTPPVSSRIWSLADFLKLF